MKNSRIAMAMAGLVFATANSAASNAPVYIATPLGTLGGVSSYGNGINAGGQVTGRSSLSDIAVEHAFLHGNEVMQDLGTLGGSNSEGKAINAAGQVTGSASTAAERGHAFLYSGGRMQDLGTLDGNPDFWSDGYAIDDQGEVVGASQWTDFEYAVPHPFRYSGGAMQALPAFSGLPYGINERGDMAGTWYGRLQPSHAVVLVGGVEVSFAAESAATAINASAQATGYAPNAEGIPHAFIYSGGVMTDLGTLGGAFSVGHAIDDGGRVVGWSLTTGNSAQRAFLYSGGMMYDLNMLVVSGLAGATLTIAKGINNNGQIVANSCVPGPPYPEVCTAFRLDLAFEAATANIPTLSKGALVATALLLALAIAGLRRRYR